MKSETLNSQIDYFLKFLVIVTMGLFVSYMFSEDDYSYVSDQSINNWYDDNESELDELIEIILNNNFRGRVLCGGISDSALKYNSPETNKLIENVVKKIQPQKNEGCITVRASYSNFSSEISLEHVNIPFILSGGCVVSGKCVPTSVSYYPKDKLTIGKYSEMIGYTHYKKLGNKGWFISRNYYDLIRSIEEN